MLEAIPRIRHKDRQLIWIPIEKFDWRRVKNPKEAERLLRLFFGTISTDKLGREMLTAEGQVFVRETLPDYLWKQLKAKNYRNANAMFKYASHHPKTIINMSNAMGGITTLYEFKARDEYLFARGGIPRIYELGMKLPYEPLSPKWLTSAHVDRAPVVFGPKIYGKMTQTNLKKLFSNALVKGRQEAYMIHPSPRSYVSYIGLGADYPVKSVKESVVKHMRRYLPYLRKGESLKAVDLLDRSLDRWKSGNIPNLKGLFKETLDLVREGQISKSLFQRFWFRMSSLSYDLKLVMTPSVYRELKKGIIAFSLSKRWTPLGLRLQ